MAAVTLATSTSAGAAEAKAWRSDPVGSGAGAGSTGARATPPIASLSFLAALFETGVCAAGGAISAVAAGRLARPRRLVAAAPAIRRQLIARMAIALVKPLSVPRTTNHFTENWPINKA